MLKYSSEVTATRQYCFDMCTLQRKAKKSLTIAMIRGVMLSTIRNNIVDSEGFLKIANFLASFHRKK